MRMKDNYWTYLKDSRKLIGFAFLSVVVFAQMGCTHHEKYPEKEMGNHAFYKSGKYSGSHPEMGFHHRDFSSSLQEELSLTAEQKEAFRRIDKDYRKMVIEKEAQIRSGEVDLAMLLEAPEIDRAALSKQVNLIGEFKKEMMMSRIDSLLELKGILNEAQYAEFRDILKKRMENLSRASPH